MLNGWNHGHSSGRLEGLPFLFLFLICPAEHLIRVISLTSRPRRSLYTLNQIEIRWQEPTSANGLLQLGPQKLIGGTNISRLSGVSGLLLLLCVWTWRIQELFSFRSFFKIIYSKTTICDITAWKVNKPRGSNLLTSDLLMTACDRKSGAELWQEPLVLVLRLEEGRTEARPYGERQSMRSDRGFFLQTAALITPQEEAPADETWTYMTWRRGCFTDGCSRRSSGRWFLLCGCHFAVCSEDTLENKRGLSCNSVNH